MDDHEAATGVPDCEDEDCEAVGVPFGYCIHADTYND